MVLIAYAIYAAEHSRFGNIDDLNFKQNIIKTVSAIV
jgi:hypothetical protein